MTQNKEIKKKNSPVTVRVECDCGGEILELSYWNDDDMYFLTMYKSSIDNSFWWRLKQAWKYFRKGEFEGNSIVLYKDEFKKFVDELQKHKQ